MNMNKVLNFIAENDIQPEALFALVEKVQKLDLNKEANIRSVIKEVSALANKPVDPALEDKVVKEVLKNGVTDNIFDIIK